MYVCVRACMHSCQYIGVSHAIRVYVCACTCLCAVCTRHMYICQCATFCPNTLYRYLDRWTRELCANLSEPNGAARFATSSSSTFCTIDLWGQGLANSWWGLQEGSFCPLTASLRAHGCNHVKPQPLSLVYLLVI